MINLVTVCGHNTTMLKHMLNHYKDIVDDIFVVVYLSSDKDKVLSEVDEITRDLNIDISKTTAEVAKIMASNPRRISEIQITVNFTKSYDQRIKKILEKAALACPVSNSLHPDLKQNILFNWPS